MAVGFFDECIHVIFMRHQITNGELGQAVDAPRLKEAFESGEVDIDDEDLAAELSRIRYEFTSNGKIKIQAKQDFKAMYGYSPDHADAMVLAWAESDAEYRRLPVTFL